MNTLDKRNLVELIRHHNAITAITPSALRQKIDEIENKEGAWAWADLHCTRDDRNRSQERVALLVCADDENN